MQKLYDDRTKEEKVTFEKTGLSGGTLNIDYALTPHFQYEETVSPIVLDILASWIREQTQIN